VANRDAFRTQLPRPGARTRLHSSRARHASGPQCEWRNVSTAEQHCSKWNECEGFNCVKGFVTNPGGCGDCDSSWCTCTLILKCYTRGNGTTVSGGDSGDTQDYAYAKAGSASGWLTFPALAAVATDPPGTSAGCYLKPGAPKQYKALCEAQQTAAACNNLNEPCAWSDGPAPPPPASASRRSVVLVLLQDWELTTILRY
jgi:hypothetical protein